MFTQPCFIRKRDTDLIKELMQLGYQWPTQSQGNALSVDYDGYITELILLPEDILYGTIDCQANKEMFLALAALRNDSNKHQWFVHEKTNYWTLCFHKEFHFFGINPDNITEWADFADQFHKATVTEIMEHFKNKQHEID